MQKHEERPDADTTTQLVQLLPELALALYDTAPHHEAEQNLRGATLTARQTRAVMFLARRGAVTMSEFADGLEISRAAATELAARLIEKGVARRQADANDRRKILVTLDGQAQRYAADTLSGWRRHLEAAFAAYPAIDSNTLVEFLRALILQLRGEACR